MNVIQNMKVKPHKLKINATMSAICSKNNLIPNKVLAVIKQKVSQVTDKVCYGNLIKIDDTEVDFVILPNPDTLNLKKLIRQTSSDDLEEALKRLPASGNVLYDGVTNTTLQKIRFNKFSTLALKARIFIHLR